MDICAVAKKEVPKLYKSPEFRYKEEIVKKHIEITVLSMLSDRPMSGYDIIKEIFALYNVLVSQGTIYSLLYTLKDEGILRVGFAKGDLREKIYSCTQEGKQDIDKRMAEFIETEEHFLNTIKKFGSDV
ncbi:MAG: PadR family transcriptional regulator [Candidatus Methanoperedens sp.]|nr:PadR family transcriptional regulator [Candidatus Methanoperedens sp.]